LLLESSISTLVAFRVFLRRRSHAALNVLAFRQEVGGLAPCQLPESLRSGLGIEFISHQEALDTSTPMGRAMFTSIAAMAELERSIIRERVVAGLEYARQHGTKSGKAVGRPKAVFRRDEVAALKQQGLSLRQIARKLGVGLGTVRRVLQNGNRTPEVCQNPAAEAV
jgi:hypothetical protein